MPEGLEWRIFTALTASIMITYAVKHLNMAYMVYLDSMIIGKPEGENRITE
jgi:hypothetical protein